MPGLPSQFVAGAFEGPVGDVGAAISRGPGSFDSGANPFGVPILQTLDNLLGAMHLLPTDIAERINPHTDEVLTAGGTDFGTTVAGDSREVRHQVADYEPGTLAQLVSDVYDHIPLAGSVADQVWLHNLEVNDYEASPHASAALFDVQNANGVRRMLGVRSELEPWFVWVWRSYHATTDPDMFSYILGAGDPATQETGEADLTFMRRVLPARDWGTGGSVAKPHMTATFANHTYEVYYSPIKTSVTIAEPDFVEGMLAVKPSEWADLVDGGLSMADALSTPWKVALSGAVEAVRYTGAAHFLVVQHKVEDGAGIMPPTGRQALLHPMNISPGAQLPTETDVEFLNRIGAGGLTWEWKSGANSIAYATDTDMGAGVVEEYYYSPLDRFPNAQRMLVYTPNSGPPDRSLWEDAVALMSRLPISFE